MPPKASCARASIVGHCPNDAGPVARHRRAAGRKRPAPSRQAQRRATLGLPKVAAGQSRLRSPARRLLVGDIRAAGRAATQNQCRRSHNGRRLRHADAAEIFRSAVAHRHRKVDGRTGAAFARQRDRCAPRYARRRAPALPVPACTGGRARIQAALCRRGAGARAFQGSRDAHLRLRDGRTRHLRHAGRHQSRDETGPPDLDGNGLCAAACRQLDRRVGAVRRRFHLATRGARHARRYTGRTRARANGQDRVDPGDDAHRAQRAARMEPARRAVAHAAGTSGFTC